MKTIELTNGVSIPIIGYGTFKISDEEVEKNVLDALKAGYRHIDTATIYGNEKGIGNALSKCGIPRDELFITTKVWNADQGYEETLAAFDKSLALLQLDYVDLYLIHWPKDKSVDTWRAMEEIYRSKRARAIGVSNFHQHHLEAILETATIKPMINQIERHPFLDQSALFDYCQKHGIFCQSWSPLGKGLVFKDETLAQLATKYQRSVSQIVIRWQIQTGWITIPKSSKFERMIENKDVFDFVLDDEDIDTINQLDRHERTGSDPDNFDF